MFQPLFKAENDRFGALIQYQVTDMNDQDKMSHSVGKKETKLTEYFLNDGLNIFKNNELDQVDVVDVDLEDEP